MSMPVPAKLDYQRTSTTPIGAPWTSMACAAALLGLLIGIVYGVDRWAALASLPTSPGIGGPAPIDWGGLALQARLILELIAAAAMTIGGLFVFLKFGAARAVLLSGAAWITASTIISMLMIDSQLSYGQIYRFEVGEHIILSVGLVMYTTLASCILLRRDLFRRGWGTSSPAIMGPANRVF